MPRPTPPTAHLLRSLHRVARQHPLDRKLVVAPSFGAGRELLRRLALLGSGWVGFDVTTPRPLASRVARAALAEQGLRSMDTFDRQALLDEALDAALAAGFDDAGLGELSEGVGFRQTVHDAVDELRLAGIDPRRLRTSRMRDVRKRRFLARVLERYEALLAERRRADTATILRLALDTLGPDGDVAAALGVDVVLLLPGLETRGLTGRVVDRLLRGGAEVVRADPVEGLEPPDGRLWAAADAESDASFLHAPGRVPEGLRTEAVSLFSAASPTDELREVLRRAAQQGLRWDEVEIVTPDPDTYGSALHALSVRLGIPVTYAAGLPMERTQAGRVVHAYLDWIEGGFQAQPIRRLLEAGDLRPPTRELRGHAPAALARRFRSLRVGWGRKRYRTQIKAAQAAAESLRPRPWESAEAFERRADRVRGELEALRYILFPALKATPSVPDRLGEGGEPVSPAELARGLRAFLRRVPPGRGPDAAAREAIGVRLERVEATLRRRTGFEAAVTILRRHLDITVRAPEPEPKSPDDLGAPFRSEGGHLHLSDVAHGGLSGRRVVFVVGVDADRVPGGGGQDPVLLDADRAVLGHGLPTATDRLRERIFDFAVFFARVRGSVTLSYSAWSGVDARVVAPSAALLQALRLARRDPAADYEALRNALGRVASALPGAGRPALDGDDVWMTALEDGGTLRPGLDAVRRAFPRLDGGLAARQERLGGTPGPHQGVVTPRPDALDPRRNDRLVLSASRLEDLGACPLRFLYKSVLRVYPPDDIELDPDRWLDPLARGRLLHEVFEGALRAAKEQGLGRADPGLERVALGVLTGRVTATRAEIPSPGEGVARREVTGLEEDVRSFVRLIREEGAPWVKLELTFGLEDDGPLELDVEGGTVRLRGAVDRVDENLEGLHVIDYKTGVPRDFQPSAGAFNGGRRLQHAVYAAAAERLLGGQVVTGEYHFPTRRGENTVHRFPRVRIAGAGALLGHMLDGVAAGTFVPTNDESDCRFCDYAEVCRVRTSDWGKIDSPLASWSDEHLNTGIQPAFTHLKRVRSFEE